MQKKMKKENGSVTILVLASIFVILIVLINLYVASTNESRSQKEALRKIQEAYSMTDEEIEQMYNKLTDGSIEKVNAPQLMVGMKKVMYTLPTENTKGALVQEGEADFKENEWYSYANKQWANAKTEDGSIWVWIPRFAYKTTANGIKIKFLLETTDEYYDDQGNIQTAKREGDENTESSYVVHPAFTKQTDDGETKELEGIWISKFEAGYAGENNNAPVKKVEEDATTNYPTFQGLTYSVDKETENDILENLTQAGNIYGLTQKTSSHETKEVEVEAILLLIKSEYGAGEANICTNSVKLNEILNTEETQNQYQVTCVTTGKQEGQATEENITSINNTTGNNPTSEGVYTWNQKSGEKASSTGTIYGIYDFNENKETDKLLGNRATLVAK